MRLIRIVFWLIALPFRATIYFLRLIAKPGAELTGVVAAMFWILSALWSKDLLKMPPGEAVTIWLANFAADANIYAAVLTGISIFLMAFVDFAGKEDIYDLRHRIVELEIDLRRMRNEAQS